MADSTIDSELFILQDNWPGDADPGLVQDPPRDGFTGSDHHNSSTAVYQVGAKIQIYNEGTSGKAGWATFIYLQVGTQDATTVLAAKSLVVPDSSTTWYQVTNDPLQAVVLPCGMAAYALSAMTNAYYGWFWCGGVCPEEAVSGLAGTYVTEGNVVAGDLTAHEAAAGVIGLGPRAAGEGCIGFAIAGDVT
jgi:hypothetical protein